MAGFLFTRHQLCGFVGYRTIQARKRIAWPTEVCFVVAEDVQRQSSRQVIFHGFFRAVVTGEIR